MKFLQWILNVLIFNYFSVFPSLRNYNAPYSFHYLPGIANKQTIKTKILLNYKQNLVLSDPDKRGRRDNNRMIFHTLHQNICYDPSLEPSH